MWLWLPWGLVVGAACVQIDDRLVRVLAEVVGGALGRRLELALVLRSGVFGLTTAEKSQVLVKLDQAPDELGEGREPLLASWRRQNVSLRMFGNSERRSKAAVT